jgi:N-acyl-D-aspartate/D-glutamate deacylase
MIDTFSYSTRLLEKGVREFGVISLEQAIHKITQRPAEYFGLIDRGLIKPGYHADIVVFDAATVRPGLAYNRYDVPGGDEVFRIYADAIGVDHVFVNGTQIVSNGEHTGALPGSVIRSGKDTRTVALDALRDKAPELAAAK